MRSIFLKNLWSKRRYYIIVLLCGIFQTAVIFLLNVLDDCLNVIITGKTSGTVEVYESYFVLGYTYVLLFFLMALILTSYIQNRFSDYAMLESLGLKKKHKYQFVATEYGSIILISVGAGLAVGRGLAELLKAGLKMIFADVTSQIYYGGSPLKVTLAVELIMFGCLFVFFDETIACLGIDSLLYFGKKSGKQYKKSTVRTGAGVILLLVPFVSLWLYWGRKVSSFPLFTTIIGLYLIMISLIGGYLSRLKKKRKYFRQILWLDGWYQCFSYNVKLSFIIAAFLFIINFGFSVSMFDNLPLEMTDNYPYDIVWMADQKDEEFIKTLEKEYGAEVRTQSCIRVTSGDMGEHIGISASFYEQWTGEHLELDGKEIYVIYQRERSDGDSPGMDYGAKTPSLYIGPPRDDLWLFLNGVSIARTPPFEEDYRIVGSENRVLTGVFQNLDSENIIVFSDEYYDRVREDAYGSNMIVMFTVSEHYDEVMEQIEDYIDGDSESPVYEKQQLLFESRSEHLIYFVTAGSNVFVLFLCGIFVLIIKMENDDLEIKWKHELYLRSGMGRKKRIQCIWKEVSLSGRLALVFGLILSTVFVAAKIFTKRMSAYWAWRYLAQMLTLILGIGLVIAVIVAVFAWRSVRKIERRDEIE